MVCNNKLITTSTVTTFWLSDYYVTNIVHFLIWISSAIEIPFGDKDQKGDYTLQIGDFVEFNIATDRRDKLQRATNIVLVEDTFKVNGEKREMVRCVDSVVIQF